MKTKIVICAEGKCWNRIRNIIKYYTELEQIEVVGYMSLGKKVYQKIDGYKFIDINVSGGTDYDLVIVETETKNDFDDVRKGLCEIGVPEEKIMRASVMNVPGFSFPRYIELRKKKLTILSNNCWGGITYHSLDLPFYSPFVNLAVSTPDWIKFLENPQSYLDCELVYKGEGWASVQKREYPIGMLNDIELHFNHYYSFEEAYNTWNKRKVRINMEELFVMTFTYSKNLAERFDRLPYEKKVCFVPWKSELKSCQYLKCLDVDGGYADLPIHEFLNGCAFGDYHAYDIFELLLGNKQMRVDFF